MSSAGWERALRHERIALSRWLSVDAAGVRIARVFCEKRLKLGFNVGCPWNRTRKPGPDSEAHCRATV